MRVQLLLRLHLFSYRARKHLIGLLLFIHFYKNRMDKRIHLYTDADTRLVASAFLLYAGARRTLRSAFFKQKIHLLNESLGISTERAHTNKCRCRSPSDLFSEPLKNERELLCCVSWMAHTQLGHNTCKE